jgi:hypothetical protein
MYRNGHIYANVIWFLSHTTTAAIMVVVIDIPRDSPPEESPKTKK